MKKLLYLMLTMILLIGCSISVQASTETTVLTLESNSITDVGNRHIKVTWEKVDGVRSYVLEIADNKGFEGAVSKQTNRLYWNFASVPGDVKGTYYIRVKPSTGQWSNVVVAEYKEPEPIDPEILKDIDWFPWIPKGIDWNGIFSKWRA